MILYKYDLAHFCQAYTTSQVSVFRIQKTQDELFSLFQKKFPANEFKNRLNNGMNICYMAVQNNEPAGYAWVAYSHLHIENLDYTFPLNNNEFFIYSCYVEKNARGQGIYPFMLRKILEGHSNSRYRSAYIGVSTSNLVSIKGIEKAGFKRFKNLSYIKIGKYAWYNGNERRKNAVANAL